MENDQGCIKHSTSDKIDVSGAAMDSIVPKRKKKGVSYTLLLLVAALALFFSLKHFLSLGLKVDKNNIRIATVRNGEFIDAVNSRASVEPLSSVVLDSVETGRVEEVFVQDGDEVKVGDKLFRLSNPQRLLELLVSQADEAQQISNMLSLRVSVEASISNHVKRLNEYEFAVLKAERKVERYKELSQKGYIAKTTLEDAEDELHQSKKIFEIEKRSGESDIAIKKGALEQMELAIKGLQSGLKLVEKTVEALTVKAPISGRLTDFQLQVGEIVKPDQNIGRIDDPQNFKLLTNIDEFYRNRIVVGRKGKVQVNADIVEVEIKRVFSQIKDGQFLVELGFVDSDTLNISPGQSLNVQIFLDDARNALILPNDAYLNDARRNWVYVISESNQAERREVKLGRRSNTHVEVLDGLKPGEKVIVSGYSTFEKSEILLIN